MTLTPREGMALFWLVVVVLATLAAIGGMTVIFLIYAAHQVWRKRRASE